MKKVDVYYKFDEEMGKEFDEVTEKHSDLLDEFGQQTFDGGYLNGYDDGYGEGSDNGLIFFTGASFLAALALKYGPKLWKKLKK